ncbi:serine hydrolase [Rhodococcoides fascians]|uniref:serine hydrolase n=1 Tax=Rhodococcoides fascians TaxID=1828 RepID=UPI00055F4850|nr:MULTISPECIES: serine hydrolase [Rhodococcus]OZC74379.1 serine hydrolase [Rhodococcus sp. 06-418-1B]
MRRTIAVSASCLALLVSTGCTSTSGTDSAPEPDECTPVTSTDLNTEDGWLGLIGQAPESVSLLVDDGSGRTVEHRAEEQQPLASAVKVVHLGAYARAVAAGELDPDEQVPLLDWERWYVPGTDGGAHPAALERLGIASDGTSATDLAGTVRLDDIVSAMIQESDNAAPDYLRYRLGDDALTRAAAAGGWENFQAPTLVTQTLSLFDPALGDGDTWATAERWAFDQQFRVDVSAGLELPSYDQQVDGVQERSAQGSAAELAGFYRAIADGTFGDGSDVALRQLEHRPAPDGAAGIGFKGGNLPGVLTQAFELRRDDGTVATAVWLIDSLPADRYEAALAGFGNQQTLIVDALSSPSGFDRIACAV